VETRATMSLDTPPPPALRTAAWINVAAHAAGLTFAVLTMRPGTPAVPLSARLGYLAARPTGWTIGWLIWIACAVALVLFLWRLARAWPSRSTWTAAVVASCGALVDVSCDVTYAWVLPAHAGADPAASFLLFEHRLGVASLTVANGLYSVAILVATVGLPTGASAARALGVLTFLGGLALAGAGVTGDPLQTAGATAITIPAFMAWTLAFSAPPRG
jgi:hypothetical protein